MSITYNAAEEIKSRCNIIDVIGQVVPLKKAGSNYKGLCPFHNEKTPSFVVSETKQLYTCFGCGASGDLITFVQKYYQLEFMEAIQQLAKEYGITIKSGYRKDTNKEEYYNINREAAKFYYKALRTEGNPGYTYMHKRGITPETMNQFGIGYADQDFSGLLDHLTGLGFKEEKLLEVGLISKSKGKYYDKFRNRVMFPIINTGGKVIGFGGRSIGDGEPKYLNSPESVVFSKKNNLYGLNLTRQEIGKQDMAILVEGYMDVIVLYQYGIRNVSASLGTALTENQAKLIKRYTDKVILSYDADEAGINAALRGLDILYKEHCRVKVLHLSEGKDPDDFIRENGKKAYLDLAKKALPLADYKFSLLKKQFDMDSAEGRVDFLKKAVEVIRLLRPIEADIYIKKLAEDTKISQDAIKLELSGNAGQHFLKQKVYKTEEETSGEEEIDPLEKTILKLLLTNSSFYPRLTPYEKDAFTTHKGRCIYKGIQRLYAKGEEIDTDKLADALEREHIGTLTHILEDIRPAHKEEEIFNDCIRTIKIRELSTREKDIISKLSMADEVENKESIKKLTKELMKTQKELNTIRG